MKFIKLAVALTLVISASLQAAIPTITTTLDKVYTYGTYDGTNTTHLGSVVIIPTAFAVGCDGGFWISKEDVKENPSLVSFALSAFHAGTTVTIASDTTKKWYGSPTKVYCQIRYISLNK